MLMQVFRFGSPESLEIIHGYNSLQARHSELNRQYLDELADMATIYPRQMNQRQRFSAHLNAFNMQQSTDLSATVKAVLPLAPILQTPHEHRSDYLLAKADVAGPRLLGASILHIGYTEQIDGQEVVVSPSRGFTEAHVNLLASFAITYGAIEVTR